MMVLAYVQFVLSSILFEVDDLIFVIKVSQKIGDLTERRFVKGQRLYVRLSVITVEL